MSTSKIQAYSASEEYLRDYQKRTRQIALFWSFWVLLAYYSLWVLLVSPVKRINPNSSTIEILSKFNPLATREGCFAFVLFAIFPAIIASIGIFQLRLKNFEYLKTKTITVAPEDLIQEFQQEINKKISWNKVTQVSFFYVNREQILYIEIYEISGSKIRIYGVEPWSELINYIKEICEFRNIELEQRKARLGAKDSLIGVIRFDILLVIPLIFLSSQLKLLELYLYSNTLFIFFFILTGINIAFFSDPLDINRSKYRYQAIYILTTCLLFVLFIRWVSQYIK
jgi:hypothetical protein